jgi:hypothetical protein
LEVSPACFEANQAAFDRSGRARRAMAAKLRREMAANMATFESVIFNRPLIELLEAIDFETIADNWREQFSG